MPALTGLNLSDSADLVGDAGAVKNMVMTQDSVDAMPRIMQRTSPRYPPRARASGLTGLVTLNLLIGLSGEVIKVKVLQSTPPGVFDEAAIEAVRGWQFSPATYQGQAVKVWARQTLRFNLS